MSQDRQVFKLSDNTISQIAKLVQIAIISGTDVVDHLRMMHLESDDSNHLSPTDEYLEVFEKTLSDMMETVSLVQAQGLLSPKEDPEA